MKTISQQTGQLFFEQIQTHVEDSRLTPKERIPKYRGILEDLFQSLTKDVSTHLSNLFAKMTYYFREFDSPPTIQDHVHELRKYSNKVVHESGFLPTDEDDLRCLFFLSESVAFFSKIAVPEAIHSLYRDKEEAFSRHKKKKRVWSHERYEFRAIVESVNIPHDDSTGKLPCLIFCNTEDFGEVKLKLWNNKNENDFGTDFREFAYLLQPYQTIYVTDVIKEEGNDEEFSTIRESLLTLEPDYLVDAKELAECVQYSGDNPLLYLLNRFNKGEITDRVIVGNIVGNMLDDLVREKHGFDYKSTFARVMESNSFGMLCMANDHGRYNNQSIKQVYIEASGHEKTLKHVLDLFPKANCIVEPTFISSKFGIQGRLDLLLEKSDDPQRKDIIELKSSRRFPGISQGLYNNHKAQTLCYDLLLQSTFPNRIGNNHILYSSASIEEKPLRFVSGDHYMDKQALLMLRNRIVFNELSLADGSYGPLQKLLELGDTLPPYMKSQYEIFRSVVSSLDGVKKAYFFNFLHFIFRELKTAKVGSNSEWKSNYGYAGTWLSEKNEKLDNHNALVYLSVQDVSEQLHLTLTYQKDIFQQHHAFRRGDYCILYPTPDPEKLDPLSAQILKCYITDISDASITVSLINKQVNKSHFEQRTYWALEPDFRDTSYKQMLRSLYMLLVADLRSQQLILGESRPKFDQVVPIDDKTSLNLVQKEVVEQALAARDYYLIQGPPGTGKTSKVLCELVARKVQQNENVMVLAFTNKAVDLIGDKLQEKGLTVIRLGRSNKPFSWSSISSQTKLDLLYDKVKTTKVFIATQASFFSSMDLLKIKEFDTLIVDEASQLLEPHLVGILPNFQRFILIGDENQLPPVVIQDDYELDEAEVLESVGFTNPKYSLFDRLKKNAISRGWDNCHGMLTIHYRMHEAIAEFPNQEFYGNQLISGAYEQKVAWPLANLTYTNGAWARILGSNRLLFVPSQRESKKKCNEEEASMVNAILTQLKAAYGEEFDPLKTVGVITPFRSQIAMIRGQLGEGFEDVTIDTIERYQGSERDIIIISFAINNEGQLQAIQSLSEEGVDRKLNVAITRAKQQLILLGTEAYLEKSPLITGLLDMIKSQGGYHINPAKEKNIPTDLF